MQLDTAERVLGEEIKHQYLDLSVNIGEMFGSKVAIPLTDNSTRCFSARVIEVVFSDNSVWESDNTAIWDELTLPKRKINDVELIKQFKIKYGFEYKNHLEKEKDLWFCFCGAINKDERCYNCVSELSKLEEFDIVTLKCECDKRLIEEKEERERRQEELCIKQLKEKEEAEIQAKKNKKKIIITASILAAAVAFVIILNNIIIPSIKYNKALDLSQEGKFEEAYILFDELENFKDSENLMKTNKYNLALELLKENKLKEAKKLFYQLQDYKDAPKYFKSILSVPGKYEDTCYNVDTGKDEGKEKTTYQYDSRGNLLKEVGECTLYGGHCFNNSYEYDENNNITKEYAYGGVPFCEYVYKYDAERKIVEEYYHYLGSSNSIDDTLTEYSYDIDGNLIKEIIYEINDSTGEKENKPNVVIEYTYLDSICVKEVKKYKNGDTSITHYKYDKSGNMIESERTWDDGDKYIETFKYDLSGNILEENSDGNIYKYIYDDIGNCLGRHGESVYTDFSYYYNGDIK